MTKKIALDYLKKDYPQTYETLRKYHLDFKSKPKFIPSYNAGRIDVLREDFEDHLKYFNTDYNYQLGEQISISEYRIFKDYHGESEGVHFSKTNHDIFKTPGSVAVVKLGNPDRNNAIYEFTNSIELKYFRGISEMESAIGFKINEDNTKMGGIYYKYLEGLNLWRTLKTSDYNLTNCMLWDVGKLFSRLVQNNVFFYDSNRLNNYFIEEVKTESSEFPHKTLRLLDAEYVIPTDKLEKKELEYMIKNFVNTALSIERNGFRFLDESRLEDFLMLCLGDIKEMKHYRDTLDKIPHIEKKIDFEKCCFK